MATYMSLWRYTDEGMKKAIHNAVDLSKEWEQKAKESKITLKGVYWLQGEYDAMTIVEGDEEAVNALLFQIGSQGYLRSVTSRAFTADELKNHFNKYATAGSARR